VAQITRSLGKARDQHLSPASGALGKGNSSLTLTQFPSPDFVGNTVQGPEAEDSGGRKGRSRYILQLFFFLFNAETRSINSHYSLTIKGTLIFSGLRVLTG
jgi:hypothetical protein